MRFFKTFVYAGFEEDLFRDLRFLRPISSIVAAMTRKSFWWQQLIFGWITDSRLNAT